MVCRANIEFTITYKSDTIDVFNLTYTHRYVYTFAIGLSMFHILKCYYYVPIVSWIRPLKYRFYISSRSSSKYANLYLRILSTNGVQETLSIPYPIFISL
ncbi:hypothetical protein A214_09425 [Pseudomonas aeruginosa SJTD-1]|nr:hypothetical protein A214_09425 [Pseudomonas aeruginosa SJTD-1]